jgi:hypothetical protein
MFYTPGVFPRILPVSVCAILPIDMLCRGLFMLITPEFYRAG